MQATRWNAAERTLLVGAGLLALAMPACTTAPNPAKPQSSLPRNTPMSLQDTFKNLREWSQNRSYVALRPYIDPRAADDVIDLLVAYDELMAANTGAQQAIRKACPGIPASRFDVSSLSNSLNLFSRDVELATATESGAEGSIQVQIAGRLPLETLRFEHQGGRWVYMPGPVYHDMPGLIRGLASAMNHITLVVGDGPRTPQQVEQEFRVRIQPKLRYLREVAQMPDLATARGTP